MKRITHELTYPGATVEQVTGMLMTPAFREAVCDAQKDVQRREVSIDGTTVSIDQTQSADRIPGFAKKFVGNEIRILQEERWTSSTHGDVTVTIPGKPGQIAGTVEVVESGDGVTETVVLEITVSIPFVGGKIESLIGEKLKHSLETENRVGRTWLEGQA
ncbi:MAG: DUF2505 domain-containing protein [Nocardioides sp.]